MAISLQSALRVERAENGEWRSDNGELRMNIESTDSIESIESNLSLPKPKALYPSIPFFTLNSKL